MNEAKLSVFSHWWPLADDSVNSNILTGDLSKCEKKTYYNKKIYTVFEVGQVCGVLRSYIVYVLEVNVCHVNVVNF